MPHIHTEEGAHDLTASFFIVRMDLGEPAIVLHKHRRLGLLLMFGGHVEVKETPWQTVLHELPEETGYDPGQLRILQPSNGIHKIPGCVIHPTPTFFNTKEYPKAEKTHFHTDLCYVLLADGEPNNSPAEGESTDFVIVNLKQLRELPEELILDTYRTMGEHILTHFIYAWNGLPLSTFE